MTTWFAQNSGVNIDSVNQWNDLANGTGNWLTWASLGAADVLVANGKTAITINVAVVCGELTTIANGGTAGGGFTWPGGVAITANLRPGTTQLLTPSGSGARAITGDCFGSPSTGTAYACGPTSDTITVTGSITGGATNLARVFNNCTSMIVVGNLTGGTVAADTYAINLDAAGTIVITGNVSASSIGQAIYINSGTATVTVTGTITATTGVPAIKQNAGTLNLRHNGLLVASASGTLPVGSAILNLLIDPTSEQQHTYRVNNAGVAGAARSLYTGGVNLGQPATANVRSGTVFGASSEYTGTLAVPSPTLVAIGVATDNTVGSYSASGGLDAAGVRDALGLATANLDTQLGGIQSDTDDIPTAADIADAVWDEPTAGHTTAGTYGGRIVRSTNSNTTVQITGSHHIAADVHDVQPDGLSGSTEIIAILADTNNILDGVAWILADATGAIAAPQSATATAILTTFGATYTVQYAGLTSTGVRAAPTLSKV
jgi:hypothetical protein